MSRPTPEEQILEALTNVEEKYIEEAMPEETAQERMSATPEAEARESESKTPGKIKRIPLRRMPAWGMTVACLCLLVCAGFAVHSIFPLFLSKGAFDTKSDIKNSGTESCYAENTSSEESGIGGSGMENGEKEDNEEQLFTAMNSLWDADYAMGNPGIMLYSIDELQTGNPWSEEWESEAELTTLPVYRNLAYYDNSGITVYLEEEELLTMAQDIAEKLDTTVTYTAYEHLKDQSNVYGEDMSVVSLTATTEVATIAIEADGSGRITFTEAVELPENYSFVEYQSGGKVTTQEEAEETLEYLTDWCEDTLDMAELKGYSTYDYTINGEIIRSYAAYPEGASSREDLLNYSFQQISFVPTRDGNALKYLDFSNALASAQLIGEYPIMSLAEAEELFYRGYYLPDVNREETLEELEEGQLHSVGLVYRTHNCCRLYIPYYEFCLEHTSVNENAMGLGLKDFDYYYVPAVRKEFWAELSQVISQK